MRKSITTAVAVAVVLAVSSILTGCDGGTYPEVDLSDPTDTAVDKLYIHSPIVNGKPVDCVVYAIRNRGGLSCNWEAYNEK